MSLVSWASFIVEIMDIDKGAHSCLALADARELEEEVATPSTLPSSRVTIFPSMFYGDIQTLWEP
jgi:hypothetical protein